MFLENNALNFIFTNLNINYKLIKNGDKFEAKQRHII